MRNNIRNKVRILESSYVIGLCCYEKRSPEADSGLFFRASGAGENALARV